MHSSASLKMTHEVPYKRMEGIQRKEESARVKEEIQKKGRNASVEEEVQKNSTLQE